MKQELLQVANKYELDAFAEELEAVRSNLELSIGFLGEFSAGKSTLINALLGKKVLPAMDKPTTGNVVEVRPRRGLSESRFLARDRDGVDEVSALEFSEIAMGKAEGTACLEVPEHGLFQEGFLLVDTPGLSSLDETHTDITYGYLPQLDGAVVCIDAHQGGVSQSVKSFLQRPEIQPLLDRFIIAVTHADQLGAEDGEKVRQQVVRELESLDGAATVSASERVVLVSGLRALEGASEYSLEEFEQTFEKVFFERKRLMAKRREKLVLEEMGIELVSALEDLNESLEMSDSELEEKERKIQADIQDLENRKKEAKEQLERFGQLAREELLQVARRHKASIESADAETIESRCQALSADLTRVAEARAKRLVSDLEAPDLSGSTERVQAAVNRILQGVDLGTTVVTALIVAAMTGGGSVAANAGEAAAGGTAKAAAKRVSKESVKKAAKKAAKESTEKGLKEGAKKAGAALLTGISKVAEVLEDANPANYIGHLVADKLKKQSVGPMLVTLAYSVAADVRHYVELQYEERVIDPLARKLRTQQSNLREARKERIEGVDAVDRQKRKIERDITRLRAMLEQERAPKAVEPA